MFDILGNALGIRENGGATMSTGQTAATRVVTHVSARQPFDFDHGLAFLSRFRATAGEQGMAAGVLSCAVRADGVLAGARIRAEGEGLRYELESAEPLLPEVVAAISDRLSFFLGVEDDVAAFYALAEDDPPFLEVIQRLYGYHQVKFPSPLELLVWSILSQRVALPVALKMKHAIVAHFGNLVVLGREDLAAFPELDQLLTLEVDDLERLITNRRKAGYLHGALRGWAKLGEGFLRRGDHEAVRGQLLGLPGIGPWSAAFLMIRGLGRMERLEPDRESTRAASKVYGHPVSDEEFVELASRYGPWKGYWSHYLRAGG